MASAPEKPKLPPPSLPSAPAAATHNSKRFVLAFFVVAAYIAWSFGAWETVLERISMRPQLRPVILLVGDSLTEKGAIPKTNGWVTLLQYDYRRSVHVVPRGLSGYNTKWYLKYGIPSIQSEISSGAYVPSLIAIWLGANDAALPNGSAVAQHVPVESYKENLVLLVLHFQQMAPDAGILFITPPCVDDEVQEKNARKYEGDMKNMVVHSNTMAGIYAHACVETASKLGLSVLDLHTYFNNMTQWDRKNVLEDGLHLNKRGNNFMYQQLRQKIDVDFPNISHKLDRWQIPTYETWIEADPWLPDDNNSTILETS
ncbi:isoamyl acetate-hydrolyzing esterase 1 [Phytophthora infestans T30-4]|uniref:Isoamyl acetate-hydrolyzing esterase 1 n=1 Tax=Phytophthora infestans (strain T30-4) TaxID=403677 RepID=D0MRI0_PHYIT|nr:isoamyl acetate-hydrolyzing esterase 1 [Phytophthora infestans T30-4]EEY58099.1 isoamyl acetate-hydrolyzing esterase 1 [Phytophthora infestans T30-4]|eukprot:XP_002909285.1 isoamyl acetate-hydrolyzing esterase 1 [Phytophthora infestans T30-4]